jgi:broad specificity phosphatase PhoE
MNPVRIGLIRHFEVTTPMPSGWLTSADLSRWLDDYNRADVIRKPLDLGGITWSKCLSSDLPRAYTTAQAAFTGTIQQMPELREAEFHPFATGGLRMPLLAWRMMLRLAWLSSHKSQHTAKTAFMTRLNFLSTEVLAKTEENTLIVSHAGMIAFLRKELLKHGYSGPKCNIAENAKLYVFEKHN